MTGSGGDHISIMDDPESGMLAAIGRPRLPIYVYAPPYSPKSGGSRALHLLVERLTLLGFDAYSLALPLEDSPPETVIRHASPQLREQHAREGRKPIAVYPEVVAGNPLHVPFVVRLLLNKPGLLVPDVDLTYGTDDYFLCFDMSYAPVGRLALDFFMPLVDRSSYYPPPRGSDREGFLIFAHRSKPDLTALPGRVAPHTFASMENPRSHAELGELYRRSIAMVTWERSTAIYEALCCSCPVICMPVGPFNEAVYQQRFSGAGLIWGWHLDRLEQATRDVAKFQDIYLDLERSFDNRLRMTFDTIIAHFMRRPI